MFEPAAVRTERAVGGAAARPAGRLGRGRPRRGSGGGAVPPHRPGPARGRAAAPARVAGARPGRLQKCWWPVLRL